MRVLGVISLINSMSDLSCIQQQQQRGKLVTSRGAGGEGAEAVTHRLQLLTFSVFPVLLQLLSGILRVLVLWRFGAGCRSCRQQQTCRTIRFIKVQVRAFLGKSCPLVKWQGCQVYGILANSLKEFFYFFAVKRSSSALYKIDMVLIHHIMLIHNQDKLLVMLAH